MPHPRFGENPSPRKYSLEEVLQMMEADVVRARMIVESTIASFNGAISTLQGLLEQLYSRELESVIQNLQKAVGFLMLILNEDMRQLKEGLSNKERISSANDVVDLVGRPLTNAKDNLVKARAFLEITWKEVLAMGNNKFIREQILPLFDGLLKVSEALRVIFRDLGLLFPASPEQTNILSALRTELSALETQWDEVTSDFEKEMQNVIGYLKQKESEASEESSKTFYLLLRQAVERVWYEESLPFLRVEFLNSVATMKEKIDGVLGENNLGTLLDVGMELEEEIPLLFARGETALDELLEKLEGIGPYARALVQQLGLKDIPEPEAFESKISRLLDFSHSLKDRLLSAREKLLKELGKITGRQDSGDVQT